jgi:hypothetical protein
MRTRSFAAVIVTLVLVVVASVVALHLPRERVYTVAEVQQGLSTHPVAWIGRDVLVRGTVVTADEWQSPTLIAMFCDSNSPWCPVIAPDGHAVHLELNGTSRRTHGAVLWQTTSPPGYLLLRAHGAPAPWWVFLHNLPSVGGLVALPEARLRGQVVHVVRIQVLAPQTSCQGTPGTRGLPCDDAVLLGT